MNKQSRIHNLIRFVILGVLLITTACAAHSAPYKSLPVRQTEYMNVVALGMYTYDGKSEYWTPDRSECYPSDLMGIGENELAVWNTQRCEWDVVNENGVARGSYVNGYWQQQSSAMLSAAGDVLMPQSGEYALFHAQLVSYDADREYPLYISAKETDTAGWVSFESFSRREFVLDDIKFVESGSCHESASEQLTDFTPLDSMALLFVYWPPADGSRGTAEVFQVDHSETFVFTVRPEWAVVVPRQTCLGESGYVQYNQVESYDYVMGDATTRILDGYFRYEYDEPVTEICGPVRTFTDYRITHVANDVTAYDAVVAQWEGMDPVVLKVVYLETITFLKAPIWQSITRYQGSCPFNELPLPTVFTVGGTDYTVDTFADRDQLIESGYITITR